MQQNRQAFGPAGFILSLLYRKVFCNCFMFSKAGNTIMIYGLLTQNLSDPDLKKSRPIDGRDKMRQKQQY
ncbi:hypothetical protein [Chryseobacterium pennipullorum]|uniref:Uncharacterized protein n=1 Tax=Chryseobacterium pennipullorum TaxID=2258963 RepID=A0A3D9B5S5_9FLAO|nr:hypothetical protein [Chryseobacterium pennipullorum]REC49041.1 hypothetical protein DRF67_05655 [Chryseobacterium pennipullorum]